MALLLQLVKKATHQGAQIYLDISLQKHVAVALKLAFIQ